MIDNHSLRKALDRFEDNFSSPDQVVATKSSSTMCGYCKEETMDVLRGGQYVCPKCGKRKTDVQDENDEDDSKPWES